MSGTFLSLFNNIKVNYGKAYINFNVEKMFISEQKRVKFGYRTWKNIESRND